MRNHKFMLSCAGNLHAGFDEGKTASGKQSRGSLSNLQLLLVVSTWLVTGALQAIELPQPIAWWKMDEVKDGKVADASGHGCDLTLGDGTSLVDGGLMGKALSFDGTPGAFASFPCPALKSRTISMWTRLDPTDGPAPAGVFGNRYFFDGVSTFNYALWRGSERGNNEATIGGTTYALGSRWALGEWVHMVWIVSQNASTGEVGVSLYENGAFRNYSRKTPASSIESASTAILGNTLTKNKAYFGLIDEVKIYDVDFDAAKVIAEYKASAPEPSLLNHWKMDSATQTADGKLIVQDETGRKPLILTGCSLVDDAVSGKAAQFTGQVGCNAAVSNVVTLSEFTLMAWVKMSSSDTVNPPYLFRSVGDSGKPCQLYWTNSVCTAYVDLAGRNPINEAFVAGIKAKDSWCHVTLVASVGNNATSGNAYAQASLYIDGEKVGTGVERQLQSAAGLEQQAWMILGNATGQNPFLGLMDDVRIYRGALPDARIREVFAGCATVDAGEDFVVRRETARLAGMRGVNGMMAYQPVPGEIVWTLVSAPEGGETAEIRAPNCLSTDVMLPAMGQYRFRLTASGAESDSSHYDDVVVTRVEPAENTPPTVSVSASSDSVTQPAPVGLTATVTDADGDTVRLEWSKVSGPGGVWFEPQYFASTKAVFSEAGTYVLACTADDGYAKVKDEVMVTVGGTDTAGFMAENLYYYWPFDGVEHDMVTKTRYVLLKAVNTVQGRVGNGICATNYDVRVRAERNCPNVDKLTFSWWMYDDMEAPLFKQYGAAYTRILDLNVAELQYYNDLLIVPIKDANSTTWTFTFNSLKNGPNGSLANRWAHLALVFDLSPYTGGSWPKRLCRCFVDGKEVEMTSCTGGTKNSSNQYVFSRKTSMGMISFLGLGWGLTGNQLRCFYGTLDEIRCYSAALNEAQVQRLAFDASVVNRAPVAEITGDKSRYCTNREPLPLVGTAADDGLPTPLALTSSWSLLSGNPLGVVLPETANGQIQFNKVGIYSVQLKMTDGENVSYSDPIVYTVNPLGLRLLLK